MEKSKLTTLLVLSIVLISTCAVLVNSSPQPQHFFYGNVFVDGVPMGASDTYLLIKGVVHGVELVNYTMGDNRTYHPDNSSFDLASVTSNYVNDIPMNTDANSGNTASILAAYQNATLYLYVNNISINENPQVVGISGNDTVLNISVNDTSAPTAPGSLSATQPSAGVVNLTWTAATDNIRVRKYRVYRGTSSGVSKSSTLLGSTTNLWYADTVTANGSTYFYVVTANDTRNEGDESDEANMTVTDLVAPAVVSGLAVADLANAEGSVNVSWTANTDDTYLYRIYRNAVYNRSLVGKTNRSFIDTGLTDGQTYYYNVSACDASGNCAANYSESGAPADDLAPSIVSGLAVADVANAEGSLQISFTANSDDTQGYLLYRGTTLIADMTNVSNVSYIDTGRTDGTTYRYNVSAYDDSGNFAANATASGVSVDDLAPAQVTGLAVVASNRSLNLSWTAVTTNADTSALADLAYYRVYLNVSGTWTAIKTTTSTYYYNNTLTNDVAYQYKVAAVDDDGNAGLNSSFIEGTPAERPIISSNYADDSVFQSSVTVNITITASNGLDVARYAIYNGSGPVGSPVINATGGAAVQTFLISPSAWAEYSSYIVAVWANDSNGQTNEYNYTFEVDSHPPTIVSVGVSDSYVQNNTQVIVTVNASDVNDISTVTAEGTALTSLGNGIWNGSVALISGRSPIDVNVTDEAGNSQIDSSRGFIVDDTAPVFLAITLSDYYVRSNASVTVNVRVAEANITSVVVNGTALAHDGVGNFTGAINLTGAAGANNLTAVATDEAGNVATDRSVQYTLDNTAPVVNSVRLSDYYVQNGTAVVVTVNVTEANVSSVVAQGATLVSLGSGIYNGTILLNTTFSAVRVNVTDEAGNSQIHNSTGFRIDDADPNITSVVLSDYYVYNATTVIVTVTVNETNVSYVSVDGMNLSGSAGVYNRSINLNGSEGQRTLSVEVMDEAGNSATNGTVKYYIDMTNATIVIVQPTSGANRTTSLVQFNVTDNIYVENTSIIVLVNGAGSGFSLTNCTGTVNLSCSFMALNLTQGNNTINITARDKADNYAVSQGVTFFYDSLGPAISVYSPQANGTYTSPVLINWSAVDTGIGVVSGIGYYIGTNSTYVALNGAVNSTTIELAGGNRKLKLSANDTLGNRANSSEIRFKIVAPLNLTNVERVVENRMETVRMNITLAAGAEVENKSNATINQSFKIALNVNTTGVVIPVSLEDVDGLEVDWESAVSINTSTNNSIVRETIENNFTTAVLDMIWFDALDEMLPNDDSYFGTLMLPRNASDYTEIIFFADEDDLDLGEYVKSPVSANNHPCSGTFDNVTYSKTDTVPCFIANGTHTKVYVPHFSVVVLNNDSVGPNITVHSPDIPVENRSYFKVNFTVSADATGCKYIRNGTEVAMTLSNQLCVGDSYEWRRNGDYNFTFVAWDASENYNNGSYVVRINDTTAPNITSLSAGSIRTTSATISWTTDEPSSGIVEYGTSESLGEYEEGAANVTSSSVGLSGLESNDRYYYALTVEDMNGNEVTSATSSFNTEEAEEDDDPGSSGGDGGSGGLPATAPVSTILASKTIVWSQKINPDTPLSAKMDNEKMAFTQIDFVLNQVFSGLQMTVDSLSALPTAVKPADSIKKTYQYLRVNLNGVPAFKELTVSFRVPMKWLNDNRLDPANIVMYKTKADLKWEKTDTKLKSAEMNYAFYEAKISGFSYFAIGVEELPAEVKNETQAAVVQDEEEVAPTLVEEAEEPVVPLGVTPTAQPAAKPVDKVTHADEPIVEPEKGVGYYIGTTLFIILIVGGVGAVYYFFYRKEKII